MLMMLELVRPGDTLITRSGKALKVVHHHKPSKSGYPEVGVQVYDSIVRYAYDGSPEPASWARAVINQSVPQFIDNYYIVTINYAEVPLEVIRPESITPVNDITPIDDPNINEGDWNREVHETGAVRSKDTNGFDFDLLSPVALMCAAGVMSEGAHKYNRGNYLKGFKQSTLYQHLMMHLCMFLLGDTSEDHLGHAQWNLNAMIHFMATRPDLDDRVKYDLTPEQLAAIKERFRFTPPTKDD